MKTLLATAGERFEFESNMLIDTKEAEVPIVEVPIKTVYIEENRTSHFNPIRDSIRIYAIFGKFLFSSLSSSVVDLLFFTLFCGLLRGRVSFDYIIGATIMARVISACYNYLLNYQVVFKSKADHRGAALRYFCLAVVQMSVSALLVSHLYHLLPGGQRTAGEDPRGRAAVLHQLPDSAGVRIQKVILADKFTNSAQIPGECSLRFVIIQPHCPNWSV